MVELEGLYVLEVYVTLDPAYLPPLDGRAYEEAMRKAGRWGVSRSVD